MQRDTRVFGAAVASALLLVVLCGIVLTTGTSQQWFEWVRAPAEYSAALLEHAAWLRRIIAVDDVFVASYVTLGVLFATNLARGRQEPLLWLAGAGTVAAGVLDLDENHHLLALLAMAKDGVAIPAVEILRRSELSQLKWMLGHLAFVLLGLALPARDAFTRALRISLVAVQLPIGALTWTAEDASALVWFRYVAFIAGFVSIAWIARPTIPSSREGSGGAEDARGEPA